MKQIREEMKNCTFKPVVNYNRKKDEENESKSVGVRLFHIGRKYQERKKEREKEEEEKYSFHPSINKVILKVISFFVSFY